MEFFQALCIICFSALLAVIIWRAHSSFSGRRIGGKKTTVTVILETSGSAGELEQSVKGLTWLVSSGTLDPNTGIVIRNAGSHPESLEMALLLERDYPGVVTIE